MKKLDAEELVKEFNELRLKHFNKTFCAKELDILLHKYGFNKRIIYVMKSENVFLCEKIGTSRLYTFRNDPLYKGKMEEIIKIWRQTIRKNEIINEQSPEEVALDTLKKLNYRIQICRGFDEERFARENPELYSKYLIYESV